MACIFEQKNEEKEAGPLNANAAKEELFPDEHDLLVIEFLENIGFDKDICKSFRDKDIQFSHLNHLDDIVLQHGIRPLEDDFKKQYQNQTPLDLRRFIDRLKSIVTEDVYVFNDPIHGHIKLHPLLVKIIDTPQFQRLRYIKQLGGGYFVFPGASHNRFEHSLGVAYLAGEFVESIARHQPGLNITQSDILCVKIAGLCHDLGHGPFSHVFDGQFIPRAIGSTDWKHEQGSVMMLDHLINSNDLIPELQKYGLCDEDVVFIKELIVGPPKATEPVSSSWPYKGRPVEKSFLYEIIANKRTGIDVDKWDYFARDCHCCGLSCTFDWKRFITFARVIDDKDGVKRICCRDKEVTNLYEMFHIRANLHQRVYQHKTKLIVEDMISEALLKANEHIKIPGENNELKKISEAINDPYAYTNLNDSIIFDILKSSDADLQPARDILTRLHKRQLYRFVGVISEDYLKRNNKSDDEILKKKIKEEIISSNTAISLDDLILITAKYDYGKKEEDPLAEMLFYSKANPNEAIPKTEDDQFDQIGMPRKFLERKMYVFCRTKKVFETAKGCFDKDENSKTPYFKSPGKFSPKQEDSKRPKVNSSSSKRELSFVQ